MAILFNAETEEQYNYALEVLPPALYSGKGFLLGEPMNHRTCKVSGAVRAAYDAHVCLDGKYLVADEPMTIPEFKALNLADIVTEL